MAPWGRHALLIVAISLVAGGCGSGALFMGMSPGGGTATTDAAGRYEFSFLDIGRCDYEADCVADSYCAPLIGVCARLTRAERETTKRYSANGIGGSDHIDHEREVVAWCQAPIPCLGVELRGGQAP